MHALYFWFAVATDCCSINNSLALHHVNVNGYFLGDENMGVDCIGTVSIALMNDDKVTIYSSRSFSSSRRANQPTSFHLKIYKIDGWISVKNSGDSSVSLVMID